MGIDDLGFVGFFLGTRVLVLEKSSDGWWRGQYEGQVGWFPSNYTTPESLQQQQHQHQQVGRPLFRFLQLLSNSLSWLYFPLAAFHPSFTQFYLVLPSFSKYYLG